MLVLAKNEDHNTAEICKVTSVTSAINKISGTLMFGQTSGRGWP